MQKKILIPITATFILLAAAGFLRPLKVFAASGKVWFKAEKTELEVNEVFDVYLMLEADTPFEEFNCYIFYDEEKMSFYKGDYSVQGGDGLLKISIHATETAADSKQVLMKFVAKGVGNIVFSTTDAKMNEVGGTAVSLMSEELVVSIRSSEDLSDDTTLKSLRISPGTLEPSFSPSLHEYSATVSRSTGSIYVSAIANDENARVGIYGHNSLFPGENTVRIIVTAENGSIDEYTLNVYRELEEEQETTPTPPPSQTPTPAEPVPSEPLYPFAITSFEEDGTAFIAGTFRFEIIEDPVGYPVPDGYYKTKLMIAGRQVNVYAPEGEQSAEFVLIVLRKEGRDATLYRYDRADGTIQRFVKEDVVIHNDVGTVDNDMAEKLEDYRKGIQRLGLILALVTGGFLLTAITAVTYILKHRS